MEDNLDRKIGQDLSLLNLNKMVQKIKLICEEVVHIGIPIYHSMTNYFFLKNNLSKEIYPRRYIWSFCYLEAMEGLHLILILQSSIFEVKDCPLNQ